MSRSSSARVRAGAGSCLTTTAEDLNSPAGSACWSLKPGAKGPWLFGSEFPRLAASLRLNQHPGVVPAWRLRSLRMPLNNMTNIIRVVIADDHPTFREGLRLLLQTDPRIRVVGVA